MRTQPCGVKNLRLVAALWTLVAVVELADLTGWGHRYLGILLLAGTFHLARALPERGWRILLGTLLWFSVAVAALAVAQMWHMDRARGVFRSANFLGYYAVLYVFLRLQTCAWREGRALQRQPSCRSPVRPWLWATDTAPPLANLLSLSLSQSRGAILALGTGVCVTFARRSPLSAVLAVLGAFLACAWIRSGSEQGRLDIWRAGWQAFVQRPLLGWGQGGIWIGGLGAFYSVPLELMMETGILGLAAGAWLFTEGAWAARRQPAMLGFLAAWLVGGCFIYGTPATLVPLFLVLGRLSRCERQRNPCEGDQKRCDGADQAEALGLDARPAQAQ